MKGCRLVVGAGPEKESEDLESMDAARRVLHSSSMQRDAVFNAVDCASVPRLCFFFFFFAPNRADSARIGLYQPYRSVSVSDRYG